MADFNEKIIDEFRANDGKVGGQFEGAPLLLLHTTGARSGQERINPMMYKKDSDRLLVFASYLGSDDHPAWYHNLVSHPAVTVEVGHDSYTATATPLEGAERDEKYAAQAALYPGFAEYQEKTSRVIPVVALTRTS